MSQEDFVQIEHTGYVDYSIAGAALTVNKQRGNGILARTGVGTLTYTLPAGRGVSPTDMFVEFVAAGTVMLTCTYDRAASTPTVHQLRIFDNAGAAIDNQPGKLIFKNPQF